MDGEIGRFTFTTHSALNDAGTEYNTARDLFSKLGAKEFYKTIGFKEIAMIYGDTELSYRKTSNLINRIRYQTQGEGTPSRTLQECTEKEGANVIDYVEQQTKRILEKNEFSVDGDYLGNNLDYMTSQAITFSEEDIFDVAEECLDEDIREEVLNNPVCYECPENTVSISIDDVNVKRQESERQRGGNPEKSKRKYVHNTIAHIAKADQAYTLNGGSTTKVLCYLIGFILNNNLTGNRLQFYTDGHKSLNASILTRFKWFTNIGIILDWYHLEKKCKEQLSMAMKGRIVRNDFLGKLMPLLWLGLTDKAITLIEEMESSQIRNQNILDKLVQYLDRNRPYIPSYEIRKHLGLRNSSNLGEKMNDLIVSERQKHNGMSWSKPGSIALASITALKRNREAKNWFENQEIELKLAANS